MYHPRFRLISAPHTIVIDTLNGHPDSDIDEESLPQTQSIPASLKPCVPSLLGSVTLKKRV